MTGWIPMKDGMFWVAAQCVESWALGSGYRYARGDTGRIVRFWRESAAKKYADHLNSQQPRINGGLP